MKSVRKGCWESRFRSSAGEKFRSEVWIKRFYVIKEKKNKHDSLFH